MSTNVIEHPCSSHAVANHHDLPNTASEKPVMFVDVRTPLEFETVHIPNARNIPLPDLHKYVEELRNLAKDFSLVLVCRTQNRVQIAYEYLMNSGIPNCEILDGGISKWEADGQPVVRGRKRISLEGQVRAIAGGLIVLGTILGVMLSSWFLVLPGLVGAGLVQAGLTDSCLMGRWVAKLPMNRISSTLLNHKKGEAS